LRNIFCSVSRQGHGIHCCTGQPSKESVNECTR
jgi:hypothetical protein